MLDVKRIFFTVLVIFGTALSHAQTMRQVWMDMPDEMAPYLNRSNRTELADYVEMDVDAAIRNKLEDTTRIEKLTPDFIRVRMNAACRLEMKLLDRTGGGKVLCVVQTWMGPAADSRLSFYDTEWHPLSDIHVPAINNERLCLCPEGMTQERYEELLDMLDPRLTEITLGEVDDTVTFRRSVPLVSSDDEADLRSILVSYTAHLSSL